MKNYNIHFRAWDESRKIMVYEFSINIDSHYILIQEDDNGFTCGNYTDDMDWQEPILMQYAGIRDKNHKRYYHKDIFMVDKKLYVIEEAFCGWGYYDESQRWQWLYKVASNGEIIGNIHENPELLK